jgi:hypothetical protein
MKCTEVRDKILQGEALELAAAQQPEDEGLPPAMLGALQRELEQEASLRGRLRGLSTPVRLLLAAASLLLVGLSGLAAPRADLGLYPVLRLTLELTALGILALGGIWAWLRPLHRPAWPGWIAGLLLAAALLLPWVLAALPPAHLAHPASLAGGGDDLVARAVACFLYGAALAVPAALLTALLGRGGRSLVSLALLPALAGALGGLIGLQLHCPITGSAHLLAGHAPIGAALALVALLVHLLGRRRSR